MDEIVEKWGGWEERCAFISSVIFSYPRPRQKEGVKATIVQDKLINIRNKKNEFGPGFVEKFG